MGRSTVVTPEILERLRTAFAIGATDEEAAAFAEIGVSTLYDYQKKNKGFSEEKEALKKKPILMAKMTVVRSLNEPKDAQWYLERKLKKEFSLRSEVEHSGDPDKPIMIEIVEDKRPELD